MGIKLELSFDAADAILVAILQDSIAMHKRGWKVLKLKPDEDELEYIDAANVVINWFSVQGGGRIK